MLSQASTSSENVVVFRTLTLSHIPHFIRNNKLISIVEMRSTDFWRGFFSDFPWFATVQQRLLNDLKETYKDLEIGQLIWISNSAHLYEMHFDLMLKIVATI